MNWTVTPYQVQILSEFLFHFPSRMFIISTSSPALTLFFFTLLTIFSLFHSLGPIFTSKPFHYLPSLRAIRNGVTLSGRHGHSIITTHPVSCGPLLWLPTLMERILGPDTSTHTPPPSTYPQPAPPFDW